MTIPTEPIGSIPRPLELLDAVTASGDATDPELDPLYDKAIKDTIARFEATGSPVITDGEQRSTIFDLLRARPYQHAPDGLNTFCRRPCPAHAPADSGALSLRGMRTVIWKRRCVTPTCR